MKTLKLALGIICLGGIFTSCKKNPVLLYEDNYFEGEVFVPNVTDNSYGLIKVDVEFDRVEDADQPIAAVVFNDNTLFYGDKVSFQIYKQKDLNLTFAKILDTTDKFTLKKKFDPISEFYDVGFIDLHIEGPSNPGDRAHTKIHILRPNGNTIFPIQGIDYQPVIFKKENETTELTGLIPLSEYQQIYPITSYPNQFIDSKFEFPEIELFQSFRREIVYQGNNTPYFNVSLQHAHTYD